MLNNACLTVLRDVGQCFFHVQAPFSVGNLELYRDV